MSEPSLTPFAVGSASGLLWKGNGRTVAGIGELTRLPLDRPGGFAEAQKHLATLGSTAPLSESAGDPEPGVGPLAFSAPRLRSGIER